MTALTVRLDDGKARRLAELAEKLNRTEAELARQAVDDFLAAQEWQITEIEAGLAEADRGEFVPDEAIAETVRKYTLREPKT